MQGKIDILTLNKLNGKKYVPTVEEQSIFFSITNGMNSVR